MLKIQLKKCATVPVTRDFFALAITDHCEAPEILLGSESEYGDFSKLIPKSNYETSIMQDRYKGKIKILRGIELGEPMHNAECTKKHFVLAILT